MLLNETREKVNKYIKIALNSTQQWRTVMKKNPDPSELFSLKSLTAVFSSICAGVPAAYAQEATQDDTQDAGESLAIEEILVTATKRGALNLQDVPMTSRRRDSRSSTTTPRRFPACRSADASRADPT
jgi:hypothetical protein